MNSEEGLILTTVLSNCDFQSAVQFLQNMDNDAVRKLLSSSSDMQLLLHQPNLVRDTITASEVEVEERKQVISLIIGANPELLNEKDGNDRTPLLLSNIHPELIKHLIKLGAHLEARDKDGECLLHLAPSYLTPDQLHDIVCLVIQHCGRDRAQALYEMVTNKHETPLHCQVATMKAETLELVVSSLEIGLNTLDNNDYTVLDSAVAENRNSDFVNVLVNLGANYEYDEASPNILHYAAWHSNFEAISYFIEKGCDVNKMVVLYGQYQTPLKLALLNDAKSINLQIVTSLVERGAHVNVFHEEGDSKLLNHVLVKRNKDPNIIAIIKLLIDNGADLLSFDPHPWGLHFMCYAACYLEREQYHEVLRHLELTGREQVFHLKNGIGISPLLQAVKGMEVLLETLQVYKRQKVSFIEVDPDGKTPLMYAISAGYNVEFIEMLITRFSCDWKITDNRGWNVLHYAASQGHIAALCFLSGLLECDINSKTANGETPLQIFVEQGDKDKLDELFPKIVALGADPTLENKYGTSLYDIYFGDYNIKEMFAREKAEVDLIFEAVESYDLDNVISACEVYRRKGKRPREIWRGKYRNMNRVSPLHVAVKNGQREIVKYLLEGEGFDMKVADDPAFSNIIWYAVDSTRHGSNEQIENRKYMVSILNGLNNDLVSKTGDKLCEGFDVQNNIHIELFIQLLELGIDLIKVHNEDTKRTLLYMAGHFFDKEEYSLLIQNMARLGQLKFFNPQFICSIRYENPLFRAMRIGKLDEESLQILWESEEVNFNYVDNDGDSLLFTALRSYAVVNLSFIDVLVTRFGMNWKHRNYKLESVLHLAVKKGIEIVQYFLSLGCTVFAKDINRSTPLHAAVKWNDLKVVDLLIEKGADVNEEEKNGGKPLHFVRNMSNRGIYHYLRHRTPYKLPRMKLEEFITSLEMAMSLLEHGANPNCKNSEGKAILHSIINFHEEVFHRLCLNLVEMGYASCFTILDNKGRTALHHAVLNYRPLLQETLELFINHGVNINWKDPLNGNTIFHSAVEARLPVEFLKKLKQCGVDIHARNNFGRNALHLAILKKTHYPDKHSEIVSYLVSEGCRLSVKDKFGNTPLHYAFQLAKTLDPSNDSIIKCLSHKLSSELPLDEAIVVPFVDPFAINRRGQTAFQM